MNQKDQRQALVDTFINAIYLYDDKVLITFNYKEGTQTVTFGEATEVASEGNGSDLDCIPAPRTAAQVLCGGPFLHEKQIFPEVQSTKPDGKRAVLPAKAPPGKSGANFYGIHLQKRRCAL